MNPENTILTILAAVTLAACVSELPRAIDREMKIAEQRRLERCEYHNFDASYCGGAEVASHEH